MITHVSIAWFKWRAPKLSEKQSLAIGERVSSLGEDHFLWQFRKWVGPNPMAPPSPSLVMATMLNLEADRPAERLDNIVSLVRAVIHPAEYPIVLGFLIVISAIVWFQEGTKWMPLGWAVTLFIWAIWLVSLFRGFYKYRKWLRSLLENYRNGPK
jgi:hypothetical protein